MKVTIQSTDRKIKIDGVEARVWEGISDTGIPVSLLVANIAVYNDTQYAEREQFTAEMQSHEPQTTRAAALWPDEVTTAQLRSKNLQSNE